MFPLFHSPRGELTIFFLSRINKYPTVSKANHSNFEALKTIHNQQTTLENYLHGVLRENSGYFGVLDCREEAIVLQSGCPPGKGK